MPGNKTQMVRLAYIHGEISARKYPTCAQLADGFSVRHNLNRDLSTKTILRDIKFMREELGAPIEFDPDNNGYRYTEPNWKFENVTLSEGELFAFYVAETALRAYAGTPLADYLRRAFDRMAGMLPEKATVFTQDLAARVSFASAPVARIEKRTWDTLQRALKDEITVEITYHPWYRRKPVKRLIDPYHMFSWEGDWYVVAWCHLRRDMRTFKVTRVLGASLTRKEFLVPADFSIEKYFEGAFRISKTNKRYRVKVRFQQRIASWIREKQWHPRQKLTEEKSGAVCLEFPASDLEEVLKWVLGWGAAARVLQPPELRKRVRDEAAQMVRDLS